MIYTILITGHPQHNRANQLAIDCCEAILAKGEQIYQIFFMHDAAFTAVGSQAQYWLDLSNKHNIPLQMCISSVEARGLAVEGFDQGFQTDGLSSLADAVLSSDVVKQYG